MEPGTRFLSTPNAAAYLADKYGHGSAKTLDTYAAAAADQPFAALGVSLSTRRRRSTQGPLLG